MTDYVIAQVNIGKILYDVDDERMSGFMDALDEINALAEASEGFVWRMMDDHGNATSILIYDDPRLLINLSVWESPELLFDYVYKSKHLDFVRRRKEWFKPIFPHFCMWWIKRGEEPDPYEAKRRLEMVAKGGDSAEAFTFRKRFARPS